MKESFCDAVDTNANFLCPTPTHFVAFLAFHTHSLTMTMTIMLLLTMSTCTMKTLVSTLRRHFATLTLRLSHTTPRCRVATNPLCYCACTPLLYYATAPFSLFSTVFLRLLHHIAARLRLSNVLSAFVLIQNIKPNCKKTNIKKPQTNKQTNKQNLSSQLLRRPRKNPLVPNYLSRRLSNFSSSLSSSSSCKRASVKSESGFSTHKSRNRKIGNRKMTNPAHQSASSSSAALVVVIG